MKIINNKSIVFGLGILAILAFGAISAPLKASAQYYDDGSSYARQYPNPIPSVYYISPNVANVGDGAKTITVSGDGFIPSSVARWNGSTRPTTFIDSSHLLIHLSAGDFTGSSGRYINVFNPAPYGGYSNSAFLTINGYVVPSANTSNNNNSYTATDNNTSNSYSDTSQPGSENNTNENSASSLASNAIFGSNGVAPSGLIQWVLFGIIILLIIIIVRKLFGGSDRYHNTPLKHA